MNKIFIFSIIVSTIVISCKNKVADAPADAAEEPGTPVTVTAISNSAFTDVVELNATSSFQLKTYVKANATGYLTSVNMQLGKYVGKGQDIFTIKTKEADALGNTINALDSSFRFNGLVNIKSSGSGYVTTLNYRAGDYVQDGEQLAVISDSKSFVFLMDLPYELKPYLSINKNVQLKLPDGTQIDGYVSSAMPSVDPVSQTQSIVIKTNTAVQTPEGLIAKVALVKKYKPNATLLPKAAVLADEVQAKFWVMKMIDSTTAVKVAIVKGMTSDSSVEIISPAFAPGDKILLTGNYGLTDTAKVTVVQQ